jgi:death-on-curing protein
MQHLPIELKREYEYLTRNHPDIEGLKHPFLNLSDAFSAYFILIHYFTDASTDEEQETMMVGIRSIDLLASALGRQNITFCGKRKYTTPLDICATLFFGMVKNHSFNDGNKRTALLLLLYQLQLFGYYPKATKRQFESLVLHVAEGSIEKQYPKIYRKHKKTDDPIVKTISDLLKSMTTKKNNTYHVAPTMKTFCTALESRGVTYKLDNGKIKFTYQVPGKWRFYSPKSYTFSISFHGWTRTVGAKTARDTLNALHIYDQYATYKDIFNGSESLYDLVDNFKEPLRRLKDK